MATSTNLGSQIIAFRYQQEARARGFNKLFQDVIPAGIYRGFRLSRVSNTNIIVEPGTCVIHTINEIEDDEPIAVRVETQNNQERSLTLAGDPDHVDPDKPYIVLRFFWDDTEDNYMDMVNVGYSNDPNEEDEEKILPTDIVIGKVLMEEDTPGNWIIRESDPFEYSRRTVGHLRDIQEQWNNLRVRPNESNPKQLSISAGRILTSKGRFDVSNSTFPDSDIEDTGSQGRRDLVWIDENGEAQITLGTPSADPKTPDYMNRYVIAEIIRGPNRDTIEGPDIRQVQNRRRGMITSSGIILEDENENFEADNLEDAIEELFEKTDAILAEEGTDSDDSVKTYHIDWGFDSDQVNAEDVPYGDSQAIYDAEDVDAALTEVKELADTNEDNLSSLTDAFNTHDDKELSDGIHGAQLVEDTKEESDTLTKFSSNEAVREYVRTEASPDWQDNIDYVENDIVFHNGEIWRAVQESGPSTSPVQPGDEEDEDREYWVEAGGGAGTSIVEYEIHGDYSLSDFQDSEDNLLVGTPIAVKDGKAVPASKDDEDRVNVVGLLQGERGGNLFVQKIATLEIIDDICESTIGEWTDVSSEYPHGTSIQSVTLRDDGVGIAVGGNGEVARTVDSGETWTDVSSAYPHDDTITSITLRDDGVGIAVGNSGQIARTTDSGQTWTDIMSEYPHSTVRSVTLRDDGVGIVVGNSGEIARTTDSGQTWTDIMSEYPHNDFIYDITLRDDGVGIAVGDSGEIARTTDSGQTWTDVSSEYPHSGYIQSVTLRDDGLGIAGGFSGRIARTVDSGQTWTDVSSDYPHDGAITSITLRDDGIAIAGGVNGQIAITTDSGQTWTDISSEYPHSGDIRAVTRQEDNKTAIAGGNNGEIARITINLDVPSKVFLGDEKTLILETDKIKLEEYRVHLGYVSGVNGVYVTEVDIQLSEPMLITDHPQYWDSTPLGAIMYKSVDYLPEGYMTPEGQELDRDVYSELNDLYASKSYPHGDGDGSTTFNLPDYSNSDPALMIKVRHVETRTVAEKEQVDRLVYTERTDSFPADPIIGLKVWRTDLDAFFMYNGEAWIEI